MEELATYSQPVDLPGTAFEGGGGLIRDALSFSSILHIPLHIYDIRANRPGKGGLRNEHSVAIALLAQLSHAMVNGNSISSRFLTFLPNSIQEDTKRPNEILEVEVEGAAPILIIALLPYILFSRVQGPALNECNIPAEGITLRVRGGTLNIRAPSYAYLQQVFIPTLALAGLSDNIKIDPNYEQGWHTEFESIPGLINVYIKPLGTALGPFILERRGKVEEIKAIIHAPESECLMFKDIVEKELRKVLHELGPLGSTIHLDVNVAVSEKLRSYHLLLVARTEDPASWLGYEQLYPQRNTNLADPEHDLEKPLSYLTRICVRGLLEELRHGNAVDEHMEVILAIYQALASGFSSVTSPGNLKCMDDLGISIPDNVGPDITYQLNGKTLHREASWWVAEKLAGVNFIEAGGRYGCHGLGVGSNRT